MMGFEDHVQCRIYYLDKTDEVVSVERGTSGLIWFVSVLTEVDGVGGPLWLWRDRYFCQTLADAIRAIGYGNPVLLLEEPR